MFGWALIFVTTKGVYLVVGVHNVHLVQRKRGDLKRRLAWNSGRPDRQSHQMNIFWHAQLAMETPPVASQTLFQVTALPLYVQLGLVSY